VGSSGQKQPQPPDTFDQTHRTKSARPTGQKCPPNESIEEENRKKGFSPPASAELSQAKTSQEKTSQDKDETQRRVYQEGAAGIKAALQNAARNSKRRNSKRRNSKRRIQGPE